MRVREFCLVLLFAFLLVWNWNMEQRERAAAQSMRARKRPGAKSFLKSYDGSSSSSSTLSLTLVPSFSPLEVVLVWVLLALPVFSIALKISCLVAMRCF